ncbi:MAG: tRNA (adenosine(37)-N6)-dimethylallyltransferase MiaA [Gaiellaceae bacterium]
MAPEGMTTPALSGTVIAIFGPTAGGKSAVAGEIARTISTDLISADSMQAYRGLPILTNQPETPTRLVEIWPLDHEGSVGEYQRVAHDAIDTALAAGRTPVVVGGTGLYLRAALADLELPPAPAPGARERWEGVYDRLGGDGAHAALAERDPDAAAAVHPNDRRRVVRALELHEAGGSLAPPRRNLWSADTRHPTRIVGLGVPKDVLEARIEARTREMFARGVRQEVESALAGPVSATAAQIIGLREVADLPEEKAAAAIVLRTRQYAAYQRKWMRRIPELSLVEAEGDPSDAAAEILRAVEISPF